MKPITGAILLCAFCAAPAFAGDPIFFDGFDPARFNDTGITFCGGYPTGNGPCNSSSIPGQDAQHGRDALAAAGQLQKIGGGDAGFDFTKIANNGSELPANAILGDAPDQWACTRDNVTGLMWEVKTNDPASRRYQGYTYTWYDPDSPDGNPGDSGVPTTCGGTLGIMAGCNTRNYVNRMNYEQLCGFSDWRMPTLKELISISDFGRASPAIDLIYFVYTPADSVYWSRNPVACESCGWAWGISTSGGGPRNSERAIPRSVRLVRGDDGW